LTSINQFPKAKLPAIIQQMLPGRKISGHEYIVRNPKRADKRVGSFKICVWGPKAGVWSDFAANVEGGDSISLVVYLTSLIAGHRNIAFPCTSPHLPTQEHPISKHTVYTKGGAMAAEGQKTRRALDDLMNNPDARGGCRMRNGTPTSGRGPPRKQHSTNC
jgi:hypothetical protein